jgi:hypothetical protein
MIGWAIGIRDRGWLREGMPADIVVYDLEKLSLRPTEKVTDLPDGDWRRVRRADGYRHTVVNGQVTFEDRRSAARFLPQRDRRTKSADTFQMRNYRRERRRARSSCYVSDPIQGPSPRTVSRLRNSLSSLSSHFSIARLSSDRFNRV